jgi:UDP-N-acetylglucosamine:LPS N-acetylglucosamine transferase
MQGSENLSGILSNPSKAPGVPLWYMNCLSRLQNEPSNSIKNSTLTFLGMVSGPEPQRTLLENILWHQGNDLGVPFVIVAGLPKQKLYNKITAKGALYHHLEAKELTAQIMNAAYIICRGGYTTLMELIPFNKKLIFIPTPGQTEQEYLARYWQSKNWAFYIHQSDFNLSSALEKANAFNYQSPPYIAFSADALSTELKRLSL